MAAAIIGTLSMIKYHIHVVTSVAPVSLNVSIVGKTVPHMTICQCSYKLGGIVLKGVFIFFLKVVTDPENA